MQSKISLIVAMTEQGIIGNNNALLWHLPNDLKHFKQLTLNKPVIMGRKTYESIGKPLPNRENIILTHQNIEMAGCTIVHSVAQALKLTKTAPEVMVIGGGEIYRLFYPRASTMYITYVLADLSGDTHFVAFDHSEWQIESEQQQSTDEKHRYPYRFVTFKRVSDDFRSL